MWPYLLAGGATLLEMQAGRAAGQAEIDAGSADMTSALVSGSFREKGISEKRDRVLSSMRARAGASGVELTGSPLEVLMHAAGQAERDLIISRLTTDRNVNTAQARIRSGAAKEQGALTEGIFKLGALGVDYAKQSGTGYKSPSEPRFTDEELRQYGWD